MAKNAPSLLKEFGGLATELFCAKTRVKSVMIGIAIGAIIGAVLYRAFTTTTNG